MCRKNIFLFRFEFLKFSEKNKYNFKKKNKSKIHDFIIKNYKNTKFLKYMKKSKLGNLVLISWLEF